MPPNFSSINTLLLYATGTPRRRKIAADTVFQDVLKVRKGSVLERVIKSNSFANRAYRDSYESLGYVRDWYDAFANSTLFQVTPCNINRLIQSSRILKDIQTFDLVVVLHSAAGDDMRRLLSLVERLENRACPLAVFFGNEYDLMKGKKRFAKKAGADFICSQLPDAAAKFLYDDIEHAQILSMPHALNPSVFNSDFSPERPLDIGFIGARYPRWIGDEERNRLIDAVSRYEGDLRIDIRTGSGNITRESWSAFLASSKATIGAEAGTYFLDKDGAFINTLKELERSVPAKTIDDASFHEHLDELLSGKVEGKDYVSGKAITSRHFEAIGTRTVQIMLSGSYNDILTPDVHFLEVSRDLSNLADVLQRARDSHERQRVTGEAFNLCMEAHTYAHRVEQFARSVF